MTVLDPKQEALCEQTQWDFSHLRAMFINCTLKRSPEQSPVSHGSARSDSWTIADARLSLGA